jgi:hypothetical protein
MRNTHRCLRTDLQQHQTWRGGRCSGCLRTFPPSHAPFPSPFRIPRPIPLSYARPPPCTRRTMVEIHGSELMEAETQLQKQRLQMGVDALFSAPYLPSAVEKPQPAALRRLRTADLGQGGTPAALEATRCASSLGVEGGDCPSTATTRSYYSPNF